ncbi:MAG: hypothetical protein ABFR97_08215 [Thermodesulfobacteriota bacterium]
MQGGKIYKTVGVLLVIGLGMSACGDDGGSGDLPSGGSGDASPGGIWAGQVEFADSGETIETMGLCTEEGELRFLNGDGEKTTGTFTVKGNEFDAEFTSYALSGQLFPQNDLPVITGTATGYVYEKDAITGDASYLGGEPAFSFRILYDQTYERGSSLSAIAGTYTYSEAGGSSVTYTIGSNGDLSGSNSDGCQVAGSVAIINPDYNMYRATMTFSDCSQNNGTYRGLAALLDEVGEENNTLAISVANESYMLSVFLLGS